VSIPLSATRGGDRWKTSSSSLLDDIKTKQLQWDGHVQRMEEGRLPKEAMNWRPPGRRKRGRPKLTWAEGIRGLMEEKGLTFKNRVSYI